jgi:hypothetical protein
MLCTSSSFCRSPVNVLFPSVSPPQEYHADHKDEKAVEHEVGIPLDVFSVKAFINRLMPF